jgi:hypothetical protein
MGTNCAVYLANFYLFTYEFDFIKHLLKSNTCPVVLHSLSLVRTFVDDLFVPDFPETSCTLTKTLLVAAYTQKPLVSWIVRLKASLVISWIKLWDRVLKVYPVTFLTNALNQSMQVLKWLECLMFILISQWLWSWGLSIVNFTDSWDFVVVRSFLSSRWSVLLSFWRQGYPLKVLLKRTRGLVLKEKLLFGISAFGIFRMILLRVI